MNYKPNVWTIAFAVLIMTSAVIAGTEYFDNKTDALAALNNPITLTKDKCRVLSVTETIDAEGSKGIVALIQVGFFKPNWDRRLASVTVSSTNQGTIEAETKTPCDDLWISIQNEPQFQTIDSVIVEYEKGILSNILNREYDLDKKTWENSTVEQVEP